MNTQPINHSNVSNLNGGTVFGEIAKIFDNNIQTSGAASAFYGRVKPAMTEVLLALDSFDVTAYPQAAWQMEALRTNILTCVGLIQGVATLSGTSAKH